MLQDNQSYHTSENPVNPVSSDSLLVDPAGPGRSLTCIRGHNSASERKLKRKRARIFHHHMSFMDYERARDGQIFTLDLTTRKDDKGKRDINRDFEAWRRYFENTMKWKIIFDKTRTDEGGGVLHLIISVRAKRAVWIPQELISKKWADYHGGSYVVYIKRVSDRRHGLNRARYNVSHYYSGQGAMVRHTYSFKRMGFSVGKAWKFFKGEFRRGFLFSTWCGMSPFNRTLEYWEMMQCWQKLLMKKYCVVAGAYFFLNGNMVDVGYT